VNGLSAAPVEGTGVLPGEHFTLATRGVVQQQVMRRRVDIHTRMGLRKLKVAAAW
jgi:hypothetical protein